MEKRSNLDTAYITVIASLLVAVGDLIFLFLALKSLKE